MIVNAVVDKEMDKEVEVDIVVEVDMEVIIMELLVRKMLLMEVDIHHMLQVVLMEDIHMAPLVEVCGLLVFSEQIKWLKIFI
jgi:hypothetical protein